MDTKIKKEDVLLREAVRGDIVKFETILLITKKHSLRKLKKLTLEISKEKKGEKKESAFLMKILYIGSTNLHYCFGLPAAKLSEIKSLTFFLTKRGRDMAVGPQILFNQKD